MRLCSQRFGRVQTANETGFRLLCVHLHQTKPKGATLGLLSPRDRCWGVDTVTIGALDFLVWPSLWGDFDLMGVLESS